ncbi:MAG: aldose epimerase family protein [Terrimicrobiaceae bacterium]
MKRFPHGTLPDGRIVEALTLESQGGMTMQVITYGATITSLQVPDRNGKLADVVLGFSDLAGYLAPHPYMGALIGRVAGRIRGAEIIVDGTHHSLAANDPPNHLHGGRSGFDRRLWVPGHVADDSVELTCFSPDGEEGYPGSVETRVTYTITGDHVLKVETEATTDRATPLSLTQHSYFNLAGEGRGTIEGHDLQIHAKTYAPTDDRLTLLGEQVAVGKNDFQRPRQLGTVLPDLHLAHGDLYFLRAPCDEVLEPELKDAARLYEPISGRCLTVSTTEACLQLYTGVALDGTLVGKSGHSYGPHAGLCLECEGYPDGVRTPSLGDIILRPGHTYRQTTLYAFSTT